MVTGGAGYVGSVLVPKLLKAGCCVKVLDWYIFGQHVFKSVRNHHNLEEIKGDIRNVNLLQKLLHKCDVIIHLACISNDSSCELNPILTRSVNFESFSPLVNAAKSAGVHRFIYASSASVYGISDAANISENHPLNPITDYSRYKALCEKFLIAQQSDNFVPVIIRPATICGYSPRQRLDGLVNNFTTHAFYKGQILVWGGKQFRPNIHIEDITDLYVRLLEEDESCIAGRVFNAGYQNLTVAQIADLVCSIVKQYFPQRKLQTITKSTDDIRSYHISSNKIRRQLGFKPKHSIEDAVLSLIRAFQAGKLLDAVSNNRYYNVRMMRAIEKQLMPDKTFSGA